MPLKDALILLSYIRTRKKYSYIRPKLSYEAIAAFESEVYNETIYKIAKSLIDEFGIERFVKDAEILEMCKTMSNDQIATLCQLYPEHYGLGFLDSLRKVPILAIDVV